MVGILEGTVYMAKRKTTVPDNETPAQAFVRVVEPRVGKAIKAISLVGSVVGSAYKAKDEQHAQIVTALKEAVERVEQRFAGKGDKASGFKLG